MFILIVKTTMYITHVFLPLVSLLVHALLLALYAVSVHGQSGSDMSDPRFPQPGAPWYITRSCAVANTGAVRGFCQQAKGAFAVAILMWYVHLPSPPSRTTPTPETLSNPPSSTAPSSPRTSPSPSTPSSHPAQAAPTPTPAPPPSNPPSRPTLATPRTCPPNPS